MDENLKEKLELEYCKAVEECAICGVSFDEWLKDKEKTSELTVKEERKFKPSGDGWIED